MIKFEKYYYREEEDSKLFISLNWFKFEDRFHSLYFFGTPTCEPEVMEIKKKQNENRHRWFHIGLNICGLRLSVEVRLQKVGNVRYGKLMEPEKKAAKDREMLERRARRKAKRAKLD